MLQKSRMLQIQGVKGEAVVYYRELLTRLRQGLGVPGEMQVELAKSRQWTGSGLSN